MTTTKRRVQRCCSVLLALMLACAFALGAHAAASSAAVSVEFLKERSDSESFANDCVDADREATLARLANGTYTLTLPVKQVSKVGVTGCLMGLTIGDISYDGTLTGDIEAGTGVLTIKNLPASVLTGSDSNKALLVTCNIKMDADILGTISTTARMCIWAK